VAAPDLPRTRPAKGEGDPTTVLDQPVDLIEQSRNLLHFVDDHEVLAGGLNFLSQDGRVLRETHELARCQQIDPPSPRVQRA
jgi:hypothetical protein